MSRFVLMNGGAREGAKPTSENPDSPVVSRILSRFISNGLAVCFLGAALGRLAQKELVRKQKIGRWVWVREGGSHRGCDVYEA